MTAPPGSEIRFAANVELWWRDLPQLDRIRQAAEHGFPAVELWRWWDWDVDAVGQACAEAGIEVAQFGAWDFEPRLSDPVNHPRFEDAIGAAADVARRLGTRLVNVNGPILGSDERPEAVRDGIVEALRRVVPHLEDTGLTVMIEPMNTRVDHPGYALPTSSAVLEVVREVASRHVAVNWDLYHLQVAEGDLTGHLRDAMDRVAYIQIADHPGRHEPGTGELAFPYLLRTVRELGYHGYIGLECTPERDEATATRRARDAAANSAPG